MKIAHVNPGLLQIPPTNWGAVEKIIWSSKIHLENLGHIVDIKYIDEIKPNEYDVVHVHMWNHALTLRDKEIPYVFTFHDHHAYIYGKSSILYKNNLLAMKHSNLTIVPAKYLVSYFDNIPVYLSHGVDREFFTPSNEQHSVTKLLCVGNNGFGGDSSFDRKGFGYAIEAARMLNLPITVVGPSEYNREFFKSHPELNYEHLTIKYDLSDVELLNEYHNHTFLIHATTVEAGHPPLTILEAASCGLPVLTTDCSGNLFTIRVERDSSSIVNAINSALGLYELNRYKTLDSVSNFDWVDVIKNLESLYLSTVKSDMLNSITMVYNKLERNMLDNKIFINFIDGPKFEMVGPKPKEFTVRFVDKDTNEIVYETRLQNNKWAKANRRWFTNWNIQIDDGDKLITHEFNAADKRVLIEIKSSALGDSIAWIPYILEFKKKHNCHVIVSAFNDELFRDEYPELEFVKPGSTVDDLYAQYQIGLFYDTTTHDKNYHKSSFLERPLQSVATDILGLEYSEIRPRIKKPKPFVSNRPYVCIAIHSTSQAKYWNNETGWQDVVNYIKSKGYDVYLLSKEADGYMGNRNPVGVVEVKNKTLEEIGSILLGSSFFVGIGSGLSWYAWALGVPVILISGFSKPYQEMTSGVDRIYNGSVCNGCFARHYFDRGDWNWCPDHKNTPRQFECTKHITFDMVKPYLDLHM